MPSFALLWHVHRCAEGLFSAFRSWQSPSAHLRKCRRFPTHAQTRQRFRTSITVVFLHMHGKSRPCPTMPQGSVGSWSLAAHLSMPNWERWGDNNFAGVPLKDIYDVLVRNTITNNIIFFSRWNAVESTVQRTGVIQFHILVALQKLKGVPVLMPLDRYRRFILQLSLYFIA